MLKTEELGHSLPTKNATVPSYLLLFVFGNLYCFSLALHWIALLAATQSRAVWLVLNSPCDRQPLSVITLFLAVSLFLIVCLCVSLSICRLTFSLAGCLVCCSFSCCMINLMLNLEAVFLEQWGITGRAGESEREKQQPAGSLTDHFLLCLCACVSFRSAICWPTSAAHTLAEGHFSVNW